MRHILLWTFIWLLILVVATCYIVRSQDSIQGVQMSLRGTGYIAHEYYDTLGNKIIRIITVGDSTKPAVVLVHGSPSSLGEWKPIYTDTSFINHYFIVAVDRPGYGMAGYGNTEIDIHKQMVMLHHILDKAHIKRPINVVGSSYGGTLAVCYAQDYPNEISSMVLMYASVKPGAEKIFKASYAINWPFVYPIFPRFLRMPTDEKFSHYAQLQTLNQWDSIRCPTLIIHGTADSLIYYANATYAQSKLRNAPVALISLEGKHHALMFSEPETMKQLLKEYLIK